MAATSKLSPYLDRRVLGKRIRKPFGSLDGDRVSVQLDLFQVLELSNFLHILGHVIFGIKLRGGGTTYRGQFQ